LINEINNNLGVDAEGWVPAEDFEEVYAEYKRLHKMWIMCRENEAD
jgi:hypothetical protein